MYNQYKEIAKETANETKTYKFTPFLQPGSNTSHTHEELYHLTNCGY